MLSRGPIHVASQQFSGEALADSSLIHALGWHGKGSAGFDGGLAQAPADALPALAEFGEWLLVILGFALAGIALRNRSSSRLDERNPAFSRLPLDL